MPDGRVVEAKADTYEQVLAALQPQAANLPPMTPPPGAVVHGADGVSTAYGAGGKPVAQTMRTVSEIGTPEEGRQSAVEGVALQNRAGNGMSPIARADRKSVV